MAKSISQKRKEFMKDLTLFFDTLDPSGDNSKKYKIFFNKMSDDEFDKYIRDFFADKKQNLYLEIVEFEREVSMENIEKCAKMFNIPLFEYVAIPFLNGSIEDAVVTPEPVPVGYIHIKRLQQTLLKKNSGSINIEKRNPKTGQVTGDDKNARISDAEMFSLTAIGADYALMEFFGPRADDSKTKNQMYNNIAKNGYVTMEELEKNPANKIAINSLDVYFAMQGLRTNLVSPTDVLPMVTRKDSGIYQK